MNIYTIQIKQEYFDWLCDLVHREDWKGYVSLLGELHRLIFVPRIEHDENRSADGIELRERYLVEEQWEDCEEALAGECSVLEMLVALANRMAFELASADISEADQATMSNCFWEMIRNLGLEPYDDSQFEELNGGYFTARVIDEFVNRKYSENGIGGIFPLAFAEEDQRYVELWYQMQNYIHERYTP